MRKKNLHIYLFLFSFIILNLYIGIKLSKKQNYQDKIVRLHVVANSNNISDQIEKLKISEKINSYIKTLKLSNNISNEEILSILNSKSNEILNIANNNSKYYATLKIGKIKYEEKQNILYNLPAGSYNSIQLILGNGTGKNIWSFIIPNEENLKNIQNFDTILPGISNIYSTDYKTDNIYSLKLVEFFKSII